jgi:hypothetical protein
MSRDYGLARGRNTMTLPDFWIVKKATGIFCPAGQSTARPLAFSPMVIYVKAG